MKDFWKNLKKPACVLAPLANVTDAAFRRIIAKYGKPDVIWTEFVSADGLCSRGRDALMLDLRYDEIERPIVAQFFTSKPENMKATARLARELGFDGIDINMGCPDRNVEKQGAGANLIKNPEVARKLIEAAKEGAGDIPVSVKTRIGYNTNIALEWIGNLLEAKPDLITIHARTRKEMSDVPARWDVVGQIVQFVHKEKGEKRPMLFGNGDVMTVEDAHEKAKIYGVDGVMIGRGIFGNPWLFNPNVAREDLPYEERLSVLLEHVFLFDELYGGKKHFDIMKKHFKAYTSGMDNAKELRVELMQTHSANDVREVIERHFPKLARASFV